jgi:hypothetical protein
LRKRGSAPGPREPKPYNPLEKRRLAESIVRELLASAPEPLGELEPFIGAGIYAIYYRGQFELYLPLAALNRDEWAYPIYVGQAIAAGRRKGAFAEVTGSQALFSRLNQHASSIRQAANLELADFTCRYLVVDEFWISLAESLLIENYRPAWNVVLDGFGNHDPGAGRHQGKRPNWDTLHPGRPWAERLQTSSLTVDQIVFKVAGHFEGMQPL